MKIISNVSELKLTLHLRTSLINKLSNQFRICLLLVVASVMSVSSASALANYQYTYTGNPFTVTTTEPNRGELPPSYDSITHTSEENVSVVFYSPTVLSSATIIGNELPFIISSSSTQVSSLPYPYPYPIEPGVGQGGPGNPYYIGTFSILAVDSLGLPTDWNISVDTHYFGGGRPVSIFVKTATSQDSMFGGRESVYQFIGELNNNPGQWRISVVPEPEIYAYMLSGLALIGLISRRRKNIEI